MFRQQAKDVFRVPNHGYYFVFGERREWNNKKTSFPPTAATVQGQTRAGPQCATHDTS